MGLNSNLKTRVGRTTTLRRPAREESDANFQDLHWASLSGACASVDLVENANESRLELMDTNMNDALGHGVTDMKSGMIQRYSYRCNKSQFHPIR